MDNPTVKKVKLSDIKPDLANANRHTERGHAMLRDSISEHGFAEAGTLDKDGRIIGGNHRFEVAGDLLAADEAIVIEVDGKQPVFIQRKDVDLATPEGRRLALLLNRVAQVSIDFDPEVLAKFMAEDVNLDGIFYEGEIEALMAGMDFDGLEGLGKDENSSFVDYDDKFMIIIECATEQNQLSLIDEFLGRGLNCKALVS